MFRLLRKCVNPRSSRGLPDPAGGSKEDRVDLGNAHPNSITPSEFSTTTDAGSSESLRQGYWDIALKLRPSFPPECSWLELSDLQGIGERAVGSGRYANVWKGRLEGREVAIKSYRYYIRFDQCDSVCTRFPGEAHAYNRLSHRNIVRFVGVYSTLQHPFSLVFEFMEHNLFEYIRGEPNASKLELVTGTARGLHHMHHLGFIHGNLEITNVLVDSEGTPRIAGLGSAIPEFPSVTCSEVPGVLTRSSAPELMDPGAFGLPSARPTKASDVYAFGVLVYQIFAGNYVFPNLRDIAAAYSMLEGSRPPRPDHPELSDRVWDMINKCWERTPSRRITIADAVSGLEAELREIRYTPSPPHRLHPITIP